MNIFDKCENSSLSRKTSSQLEGFCVVIFDFFFGFFIHAWFFYYYYYFTRYEMMEKPKTPI